MVITLKIPKKITERKPYTNMTDKKTKTLYIRLDEEDYNLAHSIAQSQGRSVTKQVIQLIRDYASKNTITPVHENAQVVTGLKSLLANQKQD